MPLPGGDSAIKRPVRIAYAYTKYFNMDEGLLLNISEKERKIIDAQLKNNFNVFYTSSMGRLFDCISALLGLIDSITYEAQAPMLLQFLSEDKKKYSSEYSYGFDFDNDSINIFPLLKGVIDDIKNKVSKYEISYKFHNTIVKFTYEGIKKLSKKYGIKKIVLSGGVMQNKTLIRFLIEKLEKSGFEVFIPQLFSVNDESIALGQVVLANFMVRNKIK